MVWRMDDVTRSAYDGETLVKQREAFHHHRTDDTLAGLLVESFEAGAPSPGSYPGIFRRLYKNPRPRWGYNSWLRGAFAGGWEEAFETGWIQGPLYVYDLNSAYLSAALEGLPHPQSFRVTRRIPEAHGLALVRAIAYRERVPPPWSIGERSLGIVLPGDVDRYGLGVDEVLFSVEWDPTAEVVDGIQMTLEKVPAAYETLRKIFWGIWAPQGGMETAIWKRGRMKTSWTLEKSPFENVVFAALIAGRVKHRLDPVVDQALEVFVDSILTRVRMPEQEGIGGWRLAEEHPGLWVDGPRQWRTGKGQWVRQAGIPLVGQKTRTEAQVSA